MMAEVASGSRASSAPSAPRLSRGILGAGADALAMALAVVAVAVLAELFAGAAFQRVVTHAAIMLTAVLALQIFSGNTGIVSFGHAAFMGLGAYVTGILTMPASLQATALKQLPAFLGGYELPFLGAIAVVIALGVVVGLVTGTPLLRLGGSSASIATLALLIIIYTLLVAGREITRGSQPFYGVPRDVGLWTAVPVALVAIAVARLFRETPIGLSARAAANEERGAAAVGVDRRAAWLASWVLSAVVAMVAGALLAGFLGAFSPKDFYFDLTFTLLAMLIVGGMGSSFGALAGVVVTMVIIEVSRRLEGGGTVLGVEVPTLFGLTQGALALAMLAIIWRRPEGLAGGVELDLLRRARRPLPRPAAEVPPHGDVAPIVVAGLSKRYAGVVAVDDVTLAFEPDRTIGIIGPNGAGKTTLINMIAGDVAPTTGTVDVGQPEGARSAAYVFARFGVARTFQNIRIFPRMTVLENVLVAARQVAPSLVAAEAAAVRELKRMGLDHLADRPATSLPYGLRRRLEVARALALNPRFLLLDEPAAGMNPVETGELIAILSAVRAERRIGVILIEHDMRLVMNLCERIVVVDHGRVIADGTPAEVRRNPDVVAAYLGSRTGARTMAAGDASAAEQSKGDQTDG